MKLLAFVLALLASPAAASTCLSAHDMTARLANDHGETPQTVAVSEDDVVLTYANPQTGTWSIIVSRGGTACMIAVGTSWALIPQGDPA